MIGEAIKKSGIARSKLFVTIKLYNNSHKPEVLSKKL
jgi:diketogulonate reductase-like aldo/keto reductase